MTGPERDISVEAPAAAPLTNRTEAVKRKTSVRGSTPAFSFPSGNCDRALPFHQRWPAQAIKGDLIHSKSQRPGRTMIRDDASRHAHGEAGA